MVNKEEANPLVRISGAITYIILTIFSLTMNILLALILLNGWKQFRKNAFYRLIWQLIFADFFAQLIQLIIAVPTTFVGQELFSNSFLPIIIFLQFDSISFYASLYFSGLITLNRLAVFFCENLNEKLFNNNRILKLIILLIWIFIFGFVILYSFTGCLKTFSPNGFFMYNICLSPSSSFNNFLKMAFLICGFLELQDLAFIYIPKIPVNGQWSYLLTFIINWSGILLNSMSPIILFIFNKEIGDGLVKLIKKIIPQRFINVTQINTIQQNIT